uniref:Transmembrane protein 266 n=1 Tax=Canis lupus familiaris TaxID=9615 RepID=A0A8I3Q567_CANLF
PVHPAQLPRPCSGPSTITAPCRGEAPLPSAGPSHHARQRPGKAEQRLPRPRRALQGHWEPRDRALRAGGWAGGPLLPWPGCEGVGRDRGAPRQVRGCVGHPQGQRKQQVCAVLPAGSVRPESAGWGPRGLSGAARHPAAGRLLPPPLGAPHGGPCARVPRGLRPFPEQPCPLGSRAARVRPHSVLLRCRAPQRRGHDPFTRPSEAGWSFTSTLGRREHPRASCCVGGVSDALGSPGGDWPARWLLCARPPQGAPAAFHRSQAPRRHHPGSGPEPRLPPQGRGQRAALPPRLGASPLVASGAGCPARAQPTPLHPAPPETAPSPALPTPLHPCTPRNSSRPSPARTPAPPETAPSPALPTPLHPCTPRNSSRPSPACTLAPLYPRTPAPPGTAPGPASPLLTAPSVSSSLRPAREGGDGDGHPAVREGQGHPRRAAGEADTDLSGARGAAPGDSVNSYGSQYYNGPSSDSGVPEPAACVVTTAAIDVHQPNISSDLFSGDTPLQLSSNGTCASATSDGASRSTHSSVPQAQSHSSRTLGSCTDCSTAREEEEEEEPSSEPGPRPRPPPGRTAEATAQDLLSSPLEGPCPPQRALDPAPVSRPGPAGSAPSSPELERRLSLFNQKNPEGFAVFQIKPVVHFQPAAPALEDKFRSLESKEQKLHRVPEA